MRRHAAQAAAQPGLALCPNGTLSYVYGGGTGFMTVSVVRPR